MRLSDFLTQSVRQVQYYPALRPILGSANAVIFFGQALFWHGKITNDFGQFSRSAAEWEEETGLSQDEQASARKKLKDIGILREEFAGMPRKLLFSLDLDRFEELVEQHFDKVTPKKTNKNSIVLQPRKHASGGTGSNKPVLQEATNRKLPTMEPELSNNIMGLEQQNSPKTLKTSSSSNKELTTLNLSSFWVDAGLQERQAQAWCGQFDIEPGLLLAQLDWARCDLVENGKAAAVKKDPISWFFGVLRQTGGCYPKPANYQSPAEIRAEQMEQAARDAEGARERQKTAELELEFQNILAVPDSDVYRQLHSNVNDFSRDVGGKALESALRDVFLAGKGVKI